MRYVNIDNVEPGQFLGKTIFSANGNVLLAEGVQLTVYMVNTLRRIGVTMVYIKDPSFDDIDVEEIVSEENKRLVMMRISETFDQVKSGKEFNSKNISVSVDRLLEDITMNREVLVQLTDIRSKDNEQYIHALNICTIATVIGINMNLNQTQLKELAIGALLHDIGKTELTVDDHSPDIKFHHTWRGFEILKNKREFSLLIAHIALQHHEAPNGGGIPRGLDGDQIHMYAKIVAVANTYDNLLYDPATGKRMLPHDACEKMMAMAGTQLDRDVLVHFTRTVSIYPTGTPVRLSSRETGVVVGQHRGLPGRPIVRVVKQELDEQLEIKEIDLAKQTTVFIEQVLA